MPRKPRTGCGCPSGSRRIHTKNGRMLCQSERTKLNKKGRRFKPFVKAHCTGS